MGVDIVRLKAEGPLVAADRLVQVWETNPRAERWGDWASYPDYLDWKRDAQAFAELAAFRYARLALAGDDPPFDFHSPDGIIYTRMRFLPASRVIGATASGSQVCADR